MSVFEAAFYCENKMVDSKDKLFYNKGIELKGRSQMCKKIVGIDLGGTTVKIGIVSTTGDVVSQWAIPTNVSDNGKYIVSDIIASIQDNLTALNMSVDDIKGIGMGSPGQIDFEKGTVVGAFNLGWASEQPVKQQFASVFHCPFFIDNDANVAALGERWKGAGDNASDVIFVTLGTGVGGGIIAAGQLLHGARGSAGEIGHIIVDEEGFTCSCGNTGCLETVASATGIVNLAKRIVSKVSDESPLREMILSNVATAKDVFDCAKQEDVLAVAIVDEFAKYLGKALAQLANALNPNYIVIGGGVSAAGDYLLEQVNAVFLNYTFPTVRQSSKLALATLGNDAGIIGAASLVIN